VLGYETGVIQKFNLQSGNDRGLFSKLDETHSLHTKEVTGLGIDMLNHHLVSCSLDHTIKLWDFYRQKLTKTYNNEYPIDNLVYNRTNNLIAISTGDLSLVILNVKDGLKKVRTFPKVANNKITDICFS
jgi:WD40 repeat protein